MVSTPEERLLYQDIQKKLFYIIPEKWENIYLYASVIDVPGQKPIGEMYFYYLPKGIIKKKYVNCYEIPNIFNIDDEQYYKLITDVYSSIKLLRERFVATRKKRWSNITISILNNVFKIEWFYDDLEKSPFDSYERHVIWRYKYLKEDVEVLSFKDKKIIASYQKYISLQSQEKRDVYQEAVYQKPVKNIIEFEKTLSIDEALAQFGNNEASREIDDKKMDDLNMDKSLSREKKYKKPFFIKKKNKFDDIIEGTDEVEKQEEKLNKQIKKFKK